MNNKLLVLLMVVIVAAAGCAPEDEEGQTDVSYTQTAGVTIQNFTVIPQEVYDTQEPTLRMVVENEGAQDAENVKIDLFNVQFGDSDDRQWEGEESVEFGDLNAANPEQNIPGRTAQRDIVLTPPDLTASEPEIPYTFGARLRYSYQTTATSEVQFMSEDRYYDQEMQKSKPDMDNTAGPIQMEIQTSTPYVFQQDQRIRVKVQNVGDGTPMVEDEEDKVELDVRTSGGISLEPRDGDLPVTVDTEIRDSGSAYFTIEDVEFDTEEDIQRTIPITFVAEYDYVTEDTTTVYVTGREE